MRWGKRVTSREHRDVEAERALDCGAKSESSVATAHLASEDFCDMGVGGGQESKLPFGMFLGGREKS